MQNYYFLMHRNEIVTLLEFSENGDIVSVAKDKNPERRPFGGKQSDADLVKWWKRRSIPETRKGLAAALNILMVDNSNDLLIKNLGLSLTDHYWIKPVDSDYTWEDINLFTNDFSDYIGNFLFSNNADDLYNIADKTVFIPSSSLQGELRKKWVIDDNGTRALIKGNYGLSCQQSLNEVLATEIHKRQNVFPYTEYKLIQLNTTEGINFGCFSKNFASKDIEFIPAIEVNMSENKPNDVSEFQHFINVCHKNGLDADYVSNFLQYQILSDFLITNTDRHFNNFGILRDTKTLKFVDVAPVFDSGNSMFWDCNINAESYNYLDINVSSFRKKEHQLLEYVENKDIFDIDKVPNENFLYSLYKQDESISDERMDNLIQSFYNKKIVIEYFKDGADINKSAFELRKKKFSEVFVL